MPELAELPVGSEDSMNSEERRGSFRCAVQTAEETGILRTRKTDLMVRLTEKSAGGFGLFSPPNPPIKVGQVLSLATASGCFEVRVAHITEMDGQCRVGLEHICDLSFMPSQGGLSGLARNGFFSLAGGGMRLTLIIALCVAFFTFGVFLPGNWWRDKLGLAKANSGGGSPFSTWSPPQREVKLAQSFINLDGLKARKFIETLKLTNEQQFKVQTVVEETSLALADLYKHKDVGPADVWSDLGLQLIHRSYEKIQRELTPEQRARWAELSK